MLPEDGAAAWMSDPEFLCSTHEIELVLQYSRERFVHYNVNRCLAEVAVFNFSVDLYFIFLTKLHEI